MSLRVTHVRVKRSGVRRMLATRGVINELERIMQLARLVAVAIAPVDTGRYVSRLLRADAVTSGVNEHGVGYARLSNDAKDPRTRFCYALALEVGTKHMRAQRILRRALSQALRARG